MSRLKLDLPSAFSFSVSLPLRISDINYNDHLGNDAVLRLVHEARMQMFNAHGWTELNVDGVGIIMSDAAIVFKSEGFYGDVIRIQIAVQDITSAGCDLVYLLTNEKSGKELARVKTGIVFFDYKARKIVAVPGAFREAFVGRG